MPRRSTSRRSNDTHPSVLALLDKYPGEPNPKAIIRSLAQEKVRIARERGWEGPPGMCPKIFCSHFGIRCFEVDHEIGGDGRLLLGRDGKARIEYARGRMIERQRFTIFHEFAHTLFPDYCDYLPCNHSPFAALSPADKEFENLCDVGAAEMLMPSDDFVRDLRQVSNLGHAEVQLLGERYGASIDAICYRLAELSDAVLLAFAFMTDQRGTFEQWGQLWVKNFSYNKLFKGYIPPGTTPPKDSVAIACYRGDSPTVGPAKETWWINNKPRTYRVEAIKLPKVDNPDYPKVVVVLLPQSYKGGPVCG